MDVPTAAGEITGDDNASPSPKESKSREISVEGGEIIESKGEVDIITVSREETAAEGGGRGRGRGKKSEKEKMKIVNTEISQEATRRTKGIEIGKQKVVYKKESTKSASSSTSAAVIVGEQESSESSADDEVARRIFRMLPSNFPKRFMKLIVDPDLNCPRILLEKRLRNADLNERKDRLSISGKKIKEPFLMEEEMKKLEAGGILAVAVIEPDGETVCSLVLRKRRRKSKEVWSYALAGGWYYAVARNSDALKNGEFVRVWYFRVNGSLWFAIEVVELTLEEFEIFKLMNENWWHKNILA